MKPTYILSSAILLFFFCYVPTMLLATTSVQKKAKTRLKVYYEKSANNDKKISIVLFKGSGKKMVKIQNAEVFLTTYNLDEEQEITSLYTNANGEAVLIIEANYLFPKDKDGNSVIKARYYGNDSLKAAKKQIKFRDLNISITFDIDDSVKIITVSAFEMDSIGNPVPIEDVELNIGVERLFSTLFLSEVETNTKGIGTFEFPDDIPGDSTGNITVLIKVDDDDDYGTVIKTANTNWGTIVDYSVIADGRSLFGDEAPLWMIISVFAILAGAWYHFVLATYKVLKIKKISNI